MITKPQSRIMFMRFIPIISSSSRPATCRRVVAFLARSHSGSSPSSRERTADLCGLSGWITRAERIKAGERVGQPLPRQEGSGVDDFGRRALKASSAPDRRRAVPSDVCWRHAPRRMTGPNPISPVEFGSLYPPDSGLRIAISIREWVVRSTPVNWASCRADRQRSPSGRTVAQYGELRAS